MLFEPAQESAWPAALKLSEQLLSLPRGLPRQVNIEVHNPTRHDIILGRRTPLGSLHLQSASKLLRHSYLLGVISSSVRTSPTPLTPRDNVVLFSVS